MDSLNDLIVSVHTVLLLAFIGTTSMLMLLTVVNRMRVRDVLLSCPRGRAYGWPIYPSLFMAAIVGLWVFGFSREQIPDPTFLMGYLTGGAFWLVADVVKGTMLVTPHGLILNINRSEDVVAWGQVVDYFEFESGRGRGVVFFYRDGGTERRRAEIEIPPSHRERFNGIARERLSGRFQYVNQELAGRQAMEE